MTTFECFLREHENVLAQKAELELKCDRHEEEKQTLIQQFEFQLNELHREKENQIHVLILENNRLAAIVLQQQQRLDETNGIINACTSA